MVFWVQRKAVKGLLNMNIISARRGIIALDAKIRQLESYRKKAKDKPAWDKKGGLKLAVAQRQVAALRKKLVAALEQQGQFSHALPPVEDGSPRG